MSSFGGIAMIDLTIEDIKKIYEVPIYQRNYSNWRSET